MSSRKRPFVILVADSNMAAVFRGYFGRDQWHRSLGCASFEFDAMYAQTVARKDVRAAVLAEAESFANESRAAASRPAHGREAVKC